MIRTVKKIVRHVVKARMRSRMKAAIKKSGKAAAKAAGKTAVKAAVRSKPVRGFLVRKAARTLLHGAFALGVLYLVSRYRAMKKQKRYKLRKAIMRKVRPTVFAKSRHDESERRTVRSMHRKAADKEKD